MLVKKLHCLLARPVFGVQPRIDNQADGAPDVALQAAIIAVGILVEANLLTEAFTVERPTFLVCRVCILFAKFRQVSELLRIS
jgi:hypothetical protein